MKITKRQLRRIIKEITDQVPAGSSRYEHFTDPIENSIQKALEMNVVMTGLDLIDHVIQDIPGHVYHQRVADYMDKMLEDGLLSWDVEEDEWKLA